MPSVTRNSGGSEIPLALKQMIKEINEKNKNEWIHNSNNIKKKKQILMETIIINTFPDSIMNHTQSIIDPES